MPWNVRARLRRARCSRAKTLPSSIPSATPHAIPAHLAELPLNDALAQLERALIARALALADGNRAEAARRLGISR